jgi:hypothetical protein
MNSLLIHTTIIYSIDAVFSERIKGLKTDVKSVRNGKQNFENKSLAILHGTANGKNPKTERKFESVLLFVEVVHFKHSATLVKSLTNANIQFNFKVDYFEDFNHCFSLYKKKGLSRCRSLF